MLWCHIRKAPKPRFAFRKDFLEKDIENQKKKKKIIRNWKGTKEKSWMESGSGGENDTGLDVRNSLML